MDLATVLETVSPTVIGFVIGAVITVIGVVITNAANTRRLRIQHEHDREMRRRERELNLRRDVYLAAIDAITTGIYLITRFSDINAPTHDLMQAYNQKSPAIGKVSIIGTPETIKAVSTFNQEVLGAFLRLTAARERLQELNRQIAQLEAQIEQLAEKQVQRYTLMGELDPGDPADAEHLRALRQKHAAGQERLEALRAEASALSNQLLHDVMRLTQQSMDEVATLDDLTVPVISAMRSELGLPFDEALYARITQESHRKVKEYLQDVIVDLEHLYEAHEEGQTSSQDAAELRPSADSGEPLQGAK